MLCHKGDYLRAQRAHRNVGGNKNASIRLLRPSSDGAFNIGKPMNGKIDRLNRELPRNRFKRTQIGGADGIIRIVHHANAGNARSNSLQSLQHFSDD
jgi:hypothetical protein